MNYAEISGERQYHFMQSCNFIREAGTSGERCAANLLEEAVRRLGLTPKTEAFLFDTCEAECQDLEVTAPYSRTYPCAAVENSGNTPAEGLEGPFFYAEEGDEISLLESRGKIVMLNSRVMPKICRKLTNAGAVGFLSICGTPLDSLEDQLPTGYDLRANGYEGIPGAVIHYRAAADLIERGASAVRLTVRQRKRTRESRNVSVRIEGTDRAEEILTLTAHYDSVPQGVGAYDNLAGAAIVMELCRYFSVYRPRRTMEFIWFGAEEKGLLGSRAYVKEHADELPRHRFNMNVDLAGQAIGGTVLGVTGSGEVERVLRPLLTAERLGCSFKNEIWSSDSNTFAWKGIPAMTMNRDGFGMHTRHDTLDLISAKSLERSASLLGCIAEYLSGSDSFPFARTIPEHMRRELETMMS
ncbi:MAG: M28 family metallopeptidase [Lachnospiraceae bacterium]|nr:M28 family metallopeptidase [Lachnospiraceae bacterium]